MKVDLNLANIEAEDLNITLKLWKWERWVNFDDNDAHDDDTENDANDDNKNEHENNLWRY